MMHRLMTATTVLTVGLGLWGCGGSNGYANGTGNPTSPTPAPDAAVVTIDVVAINGAQSFSPNPSTVPAGRQVVWHNVDTTTHRVVLDDRSVDTGALAPGASSRALTIAGSSQYHCSIHPVMVGSINLNPSTQNTALCAGASCD
jgi:plastocyanin